MEAVEYRIDLMQRHAHLYAVEARFPVGGRELDLLLPVWTPGSYLVREFERHLQDLVCDDGEGRALPVRKVDKSTWRVDARGATRIRARYRVYAWDLTVRSAHLDDTHGFWNGACVFLYARELAAHPARVTVIPPKGWHVTVGLDEDKAEPNTFVARDYDELVDSPFEVGTHELIRFEAQGKPHRLAIWGRVETPREQLRADFIKIIDAAQAVFGEPLPYPDYAFILMVAPNQYGGLEHARSCALLASPYTFAPRKKYEEFLELVSHEFFHLWNVKRIHPEALGPFDYQSEAYTRCLWVMEGITSYYDRHLLVRAGLQPPKRYLEKLGEEVGKIAGIPGRFRQSLEESSFDAWIKLYRPDENSVNSTISYYLKGGVVALLLDLEIRSRTKGQRSLDDAMRLLWRRYGSAGVGFPDDAVQSLFEEAVGIPLGTFFDRYVRGRDELDPKALLRTVGLELKAEEDHDEEKKAPAVWLGCTFKDSNAGVTITGALDGGPAVDAGLYAHDEIVALDGLRVDLSTLKDRLGTKKPGDEVTLTLFRRDELRTVTVKLGEKPPEKFSVMPVGDATAEEKAAYQAWLGQPFPEKEKAEEKPAAK
jgi:predicted metalloprotease with PDZ domain